MGRMAASETTTPAGLSVKVGYSLNGAAVGSPTQPGMYDVTTSINDLNNAGSATGVLVIQYNFAGFFHPVDNLPARNVVKAGSALPVKFSLGGDFGLDIFMAGFPKPMHVACDAADDAPIEETTTAGASGLSYDQLTGQYTYVWKTDRKWVDSCPQLILKFNDGTERNLNFRFTK